MESDKDLFCIFGPSTGYNREILLRGALIDHGEDRVWTLLCRRQALHLLPWLADKDRQSAIIDFGTRLERASPGAPTVHLRVVLLKADAFKALAALAVEPDACLKVIEYREALKKDSKLDWQTDGLLRYVFHNLDR